MCRIGSVLCVFTVLVTAIVSLEKINWDFINLPKSVFPAYVAAHTELLKACKEDPRCPLTEEQMSSRSCFGYEDGCEPKQRLYNYTLVSRSKWEKTEEGQRDRYWTAGDYGIVRSRLQSLKAICNSENDEGSTLVCDENARYCRGQNIMINLRNSKPTKMYDADYLKAGDIEGVCKKNTQVINSWNKEQRAFLQSWQHVMDHFTESKNFHCDLTIDKPVYIMQLDAVVNMFHHFCDFINLYATQHLNHTTFDTDNQIITWDTSGRSFSDPFGASFRAFTDNPVLNVNEYFGKRVCFKEVIFALPPRQRLGLFYNMPLIDGVEGSALFRHFNEHMLHRLNIPQLGPLRKKIRVTILSRETAFRNIMNENELIEALNGDPKYSAERVVYNFAKDLKERDENFLKQLKSTYNSDIFIGMHGAGLTHLLFLPHWASVIELYHCDDPRCYSTLARLRGVKYFTWKNMDKLFPEDEGRHPTLGKHKKFTNYGFDVEEFVGLVDSAASHVRQHPEYRAAKKLKYNLEKSHDEL